MLLQRVQNGPTRMSAREGLGNRNFRRGRKVLGRSDMGSIEVG